MIVYLCNAIDEETKHERAITTDSPAATKKVFGLCHSMETAGMNTLVLSMGRGRQDGSGIRFSHVRKKISGINISYAAFWQTPYLTHVVTAFSLMLLMWGIIRKGESTLLVYNRCWHYIPALCLVKLFRVRCFLDLEDGWVEKETLAQGILTLFFGWVCNSGSVLACEALAAQVKTQKNLVCYGAAKGRVKVNRNWNTKRIQVLFGGSLWEGTGADLFIKAVKLLMRKYPALKDELQIIVVGFGDMAKDIQHFALSETNGMVEFRGSVSNSEYSQLLESSHIGMCLKLSSGPFHDSTFPSKVVELSSSGLLLVSTPVSDVPSLFCSDNALLLADDSPEALADALHWAAMHREEVAVMARRGCEMISERFSPESVGIKIVSFFREAEIT